MRATRRSRTADEITRLHNFAPLIHPAQRASSQRQLKIRSQRIALSAYSRLEQALAKELASLPSAYGFDSLKDFVAAIKAAGGGGKRAGRPRRPRLPKPANAPRLPMPFGPRLVNWSRRVRRDPRSLRRWGFRCQASRTSRRPSGSSGPPRSLCASLGPALRQPSTLWYPSFRRSTYRQRSLLLPNRSQARYRMQLRRLLRPDSGHCYVGYLRC